jgi:peptidoglycan L-alanyl-D-glutamate endopeptidase CwlK
MAMIFGVVLYFLLAVALVGWIALPSWRQLAWRGAGQAARRWRGVRRRQGGHFLAVPADDRRPWLLVAALLAVVLVPAAMVVLRQQWRVEGFDHTRSRAPDLQVSALLQGADLVPPPPVPPELFATRELAAVRPLLTQANRDWALLDAEFRRRLLGVFQLMQQRHGYELVLIEGWRSPQRQNQLAAMGGHVTRAAAFESQHQFGRAADVAFLRDGRIVISEQDPWAARGYQLYGALAASFGLTWGGGWTSLRDLGHVEWRGAPLAASSALP